MLISKACAVAGLTKKAVEYYTEQELVFPTVLDNGYRDYSSEDIARLKKIGLLRTLGLNMQEIRQVVNDAGDNALQHIAVQKALLLGRDQMRSALLMKLLESKQQEDILPQLKALEAKTTIAQRLLDAFPGFFGCYLSLHFARFLNSPIETEEQDKSYRQIVAFLDDVPPLAFSTEIQTLLDQSVNRLSGEAIESIAEGMARSAEDFETFYGTYKDALEAHMEFKHSDAYRQSGVPELEAAWRCFLDTNGYYTVFLPAMKNLSPVYAEHVKRLEAANEKMLAMYPYLAGENKPVE